MTRPRFLCRYFSMILVPAAVLMMTGRCAGTVFDFTGAALPAGVSLSGQAAHQAGTGVRVGAGPGWVDTGVMSGGRAIREATIEATWQRQGASASAAGVSVALIPASGTYTGWNPAQALAGALCVTLRENAGGVFISSANGVDDPIDWPAALPANIVNSNGATMKITMRINLDTTSWIVAINDSDVLFGYLPRTLDNAGAHLVAAAAPDGGRQYVLSRLTTSYELWNKAPVLLEQPADVVHRMGYTTPLRVRSNDPLVSVYQWQRRRPADAGFLNLPGENALTLLLGAPEPGSRYRCRVSTPSGVTFSNEAAVTPVDFFVPFNAPLELSFEGGPNLADAGPGAAFANLTGTASIRTSTPLSGSRSVWLTDGGFGQLGGLGVGDLNGATGESGFLANVRVQIIPSTNPPADGFSISWGPDVPANPGPNAWEEGMGSGLRVAFDIFDNGDGEAPAVDVFWGDVLLAHAAVPLDFFNGVADVAVRLRPSGLIDVAWNNRVIHWGVPRGGLGNFNGARWFIGARTGGLASAVLVDEVRITPYPAIAGPQITAQPQAVTVWEGTPAVFSVGLAQPDNVFVTWRLLYGNSSTDIERFGTPVLTIPSTPAGWSGARILADVWNSAGFVTTQEVTITVLSRPLLPSRELHIATDAAAPPPGTQFTGNAQWKPVGLASDRALFQLTTAAQGQIGSAVLPDMDQGKTVVAWGAEFSVRVNDWTAPPADGWSFCWAADLPAAAFGESGAGSGLILSFDTYNNGGEAPSISCFWRGNLVARQPVPVEQLLTAEDFAPVSVLLTSAGRLTLFYRDRMVFSDLALPAYTGLSGARFGWGARTGFFAAAHEISDIRLGTVKSIPDIAFVPGSGRYFVTVVFEGYLDGIDWWAPDSSWDFRSNQSPYTVQSQNHPNHPDQIALPSTRWFRARAP